MYTPVPAVARRAPRWIRSVLAVALLVTGLSVAQPAQATDDDGDGISWSLGADCAVPTYEAGAVYGSPEDWQSEWVEGTQVPVCKSVDGGTPQVVGTVTVERMTIKSVNMSTLGIMNYSPSILRIESPAANGIPFIRMAPPSNPLVTGHVGNVITIDGSTSGYNSLYPDGDVPAGKDNTAFVALWVDMNSHGVPQVDSVLLDGGDEGDNLPREVPIVWEPIDQMTDWQGENGRELMREGLATADLVLHRSILETGEVKTFHERVNTHVQARYFESSTMLTLATLPDSDSEQIPVISGQNVELTADLVPPRDGYVFRGWSTQPNGAGATYRVGDSFLVPDLSESTEGVVLYGIWEQSGVNVVNRYAQYWVSAAAIGIGVGDPMPWNYIDSNYGEEGSLLNLEGLSYPYYLYNYFFTFSGWATEPDGSGVTVPSDSFGAVDGFALPPGTTNLYAQWSIKMPYYANDTIYPSQSEVASDLIPWNGIGYDYDIPPIVVSEPKFQREVYRFTGWNTRADGSGTAFQPGDLYQPGAYQDSGGAWYDINYGLWAQWAELFDVAYEFVDANGNPVPADVQALIPSGAEVVDGTAVTPAALGTTEVAAEGGTWVFRGWDSDGVEIHADHTFVGTWEFVAASVAEPSETPDPADPSIADPNAPSDGGSSGAGTPSVSTGGSIGQDAGLAGGAAFLIVGLAGLGWWRRVKVTK